MSDFLSRLAARAVGEPSRGRATAQEVVGATRAEPPVARATPTAPEVRAEPPEVRVEAEPGATMPPPREYPAAEASSAPGTVVATTVIREAATPTVAEGSGPTPEPVAERAEEPAPVVAAVPVPATPSIERHVESRLQRIQTVETVAADEPPVRVHIGRLEVRANLEQPKRPQPKREVERPRGQTLSDYLRGRKSA